MAMNLRGAVEGVQVAALGPAKSAAWEDRKRDEGCALQPAANRAVAMMGLERRLRNLELVGAAVTRARNLFEFGHGCPPPIRIASPCRHQVKRIGDRLTCRAAHPKLSQDSRGLAPRTNGVEPAMAKI